MQVAEVASQQVVVAVLVNTNAGFSKKRSKHCIQRSTMMIGLFDFKKMDYYHQGYPLR
jgi:hypothetical protein